MVDTGNNKGTNKLQKLTSTTLYGLVKLKGLGVLVGWASYKLLSSAWSVCSYLYSKAFNKSSQKYNIVSNEDHDLMVFHTQSKQPGVMSPESIPLPGFKGSSLRAGNDDELTDDESAGLQDVNFEDDNPMPPHDFTTESQVSYKPGLVNYILSCVGLGQTAKTEIHRE